MIWEYKKMMKLIDTQKYQQLSPQYQKFLIVQLQIWIAIHYLIRLCLSSYSTSHQINLLIKFYHDQPYIFAPLTEVEVIQLYFFFKPMIPFFLYLNYVKSQQQCLQLPGNTSQKIIKSKKKSNSRNSHKSQKSNKSKKSQKHMKGGYLFMLTSRGEKPIRGVDMEEFLQKMDSAVQNVGYLPSSAPPTEDNLGHPYNGFALLYFLARGQTDTAQFYMSPYYSEYTNPIESMKGAHKGDMRKYTTLYKLYEEYTEQKQKTERRENMDKEFLGDYQKFIKKYMGRKELRTQEEKYKSHLDNLKKLQEKENIESKMFGKYLKKNPIKPNKFKPYKKYMSILDQIGMVGSMIPGL